MNRYNHPHPEGTQHLEEENIQIFNKICTKFYMNVLQFLGFYFFLLSMKDFVRLRRQLDGIMNIDTYIIHNTIDMPFHCYSSSVMIVETDEIEKFTL